jgi:hypothetical protein
MHFPQKKGWCDASAVIFRLRSITTLFSTYNPDLRTRRTNCLSSWFSKLFTILFFSKKKRNYCKQGYLQVARSGLGWSQEFCGPVQPWALRRTHTLIWLIDKVRRASSNLEHYGKTPLCRLPWSLPPAKARVVGKDHLCRLPESVIPSSRQRMSLPTASQLAKTSRWQR